MYFIKLEFGKILPFKFLLLSMKRLSIGNDRLKERRAAADTFETFYFLSQTENLNDAFKSLTNILRDFNLFTFRLFK